MNETNSGTSEEGVARLDGPTRLSIDSPGVRDGVEHSFLQLACEILDLTHQILPLNGEALCRNTLASLTASTAGCRKRPKGFSVRFLKNRLAAAN